MKLWAALRNGSRGWFALVRGRPDWRENFTLTAAGAAAALLIFFFFAFLSIAFGAIGTGMPGALGIAVNMLVQALSVLALVIAVLVTRLALKSYPPVLWLVVPGIYALIFYLAAGSILASIGIEFIVLALLGLVYLLYRLGRMAGGWTIGVSVAFAVFTVVLLVGMPLTLYMLFNPAGSPI